MATLYLATAPLRITLFAYALPPYPFWRAGHPFFKADWAACDLGRRVDLGDVAAFLSGRSL